MGSIRLKIKGKLIQNALNLLNNTFWWKIRPNLASLELNVIES